MSWTSGANAWCFRYPRPRQLDGVRTLVVPEGKRRLSALPGCGGSGAFIHLLLLVWAAKHMAGSATGFGSTSYERFVGDVADNILSTYRAIVLSRAGTPHPAEAGLRKAARIPSEIPSHHGACSETTIGNAGRCPQSFRAFPASEAFPGAWRPVGSAWRPVRWAWLCLVPNSDKCAR